MLYLDIFQIGAKLYFIIVVWLPTLSKINETHPFINKVLTSICFIILHNEQLVY